LYFFTGLCEFAKQKFYEFSTFRNFHGVMLQQNVYIIVFIRISHVFSSIHPVKTTPGGVVKFADKK